MNEVNKQQHKYVPKPLFLFFAGLKSIPFRLATIHQEITGFVIVQHVSNRTHPPKSICAGC